MFNCKCQSFIIIRELKHVMEEKSQRFNGTKKGTKQRRKELKMKYKDNSNCSLIIISGLCLKRLIHIVTNRPLFLYPPCKSVVAFVSFIHKTMKPLVTPVCVGQYNYIWCIRYSNDDL